ncbi:MAG: peptide deformylase [Patescibacteria group bacterium]
MEILTNPNDFLRQKMKKVEVFDRNLQQFARDFIETMLEKDGVGLAATQIGANRRIIAINLDKKEGYPDSLIMPMVLVNPEILEASAQQVEMDEACLSVPGLVGSVIRPEEVIVTYQDLNGKQYHVDADGWLARVLQHEIDHLNGILFIDRISDKKKLRKYEVKE